MKRVFFILLVICFSCAEQKDTHVAIYGISFICPSGWIVKETKDYELSESVFSTYRGKNYTVKK
jgi:hypothetical protein